MKWPWQQAVHVVAAGDAADPPVAYVGLPLDRPRAHAGAVRVVDPGWRRPLRPPPGTRHLGAELRGPGGAAWVKAGGSTPEAFRAAVAQRAPAYEAVRYVHETAAGYFALELAPRDDWRVWLVVAPRAEGLTAAPQADIPLVLAAVGDRWHVWPLRPDVPARRDVDLREAHVCVSGRHFAAAE